jgi:hypothetical protein
MFPSIRVLILVFIVFTGGVCAAQTTNKVAKPASKEKIKFGVGYTLSSDIYHRYTNPPNNASTRNAGSAILNFGGGPKFWLGTSKVSLSIEGQAVLGVLGYSTKENKGLGTLGVPIMAKLNFKGLSAYEREGKLGFSIGGGIQYSHTELYGVTDEFKIKGVKRSFFPTYIGQVGYGFGVNGFCMNGFARYGFHPDTDAKVWSIGIQWDFNKTSMKNISNPASSLNVK